MFLTNALTLVAVIGLPVPFPQPTPVVGVIKAGHHTPHALRRWQWRKFTRVFTPLDGSASVI